jgi:uncharacterized phiE125 gp8 family phage protein
MSITRQPPDTLALALGDVKRYLKITRPNEDALVADLIKTAEDFLGEQRGHYALLRQVEVNAPLIYPPRQRLMRDPYRRYHYYPMVSLSLSPIQSIDRVVIARDDGKEKEIPSNRWVLTNSRWPRKLMLKVLTGEWARVTLTVGHGDTPDVIPPTLRHQLLALVQRLYKNRGELDSSAITFPRRLSL